MQVYLVGGAVRDKQLGRPIKDKDFVVVGATVAQMLDNGFIQVGCDFPVFLHPNTKQEYALARTERKSGKGYKGFVVHADTSVTLEQDLSRRDLTINAMAIQVQDLFDDTPVTTEVIDPFNGLKDIQDKKLRHVSTAFSEDPLRVLRVARFYGRFYEMGFGVAHSTLDLLVKLARSGELEDLTKERVWSETSRALLQPAPHAYWQLLWQIDAIKSLYPNLACAWQSNQCRDFILDSLQQAGKLNLCLEQRWAVLMASFAPNCSRPTHSTTHNADINSWVQTVQRVGQAHKLPKKLTQFALLYAQYADDIAHFDTLTAEQMAALISACKAQKDSQILQDLLTVHHTLQLTCQYHKINKVVDRFNSITIKDIAKGYQGAQIGEQINKLRIKAIADI